MRCNIYEDQFQSAELFGKPVLYTQKQVQREAVPEEWHCYLADKTVWGRTGTVLSPVPLKRETTLTRQIRNSFSLHEELLDLAGFCEKHQLECPADPRKFILRPASHQEAGLFYSQMEPERDAEEATVGHLRIDFASGWLHHSWWPHNDDRFNTPSSRRSFRSLWTSCGSGDRCKARPPCTGGVTGIRRARSGRIKLGS